MDPLVEFRWSFHFLRIGFKLIQKDIFDQRGFLSCYITTSLVFAGICYIFTMSSEYFDFEIKCFSLAGFVIGSQVSFASIY